MIWTEAPDIAGLVARAMRPIDRVRPSAWAEANVEISPDEGSPRPGPFRCDFMPFTRMLHDLVFDNPTKMGFCIIKPAQIGASRAVVNLLACQQATDPGPTLFLTNDAEKAKTFANGHFRPAVMKVAHLAEFVRATKREKRQLLQHFELPGGAVDFVGGGSESGVISVGRRYVYLDEYELSNRNFPAASGDLYGTARERTSLWPHNRVVGVFGHPRYWEEDVHAIFLAESDQGRWAWDCPHCGEIVDPTDWSALIDWREDPVTSVTVTAEDATLVCPHCSCEISDADRARTVWEPALGGTGRRHVPIEEHEAARAPLAGLWITALSSPAKPLRELAGGFLKARTPEARQTWFNKAWGGPLKKTTMLVTRGIVREIIAPPGPVILPETVRAIAAGADVQMPRENKTIYAAAGGFDDLDVLHVVAMELLGGWEAYHRWRETLAVRAGQSTLGLRLATLDCGWETSDVLDETRRTVYSVASNVLVEQLAVSFNGKCHGDAPVAEVPIAKRTHPTRPELGLVNRKYLHRHTWVDRTIRRLLDKRIVIHCAPPPGLESHLTSQVLSPRRAQHGLEEEILEWNKAKDRRDDWLMALVYLEAGAAIALSLDRRHEERPQKPVARQPGWMSRSSGGRWL
jgi:hypothetical protein